MLPSENYVHKARLLLFFVLRVDLLQMLCRESE